jgi:hypothetical protein
MPVKRMTSWRIHQKGWAHRKPDVEMKATVPKRFYEVIGNAVKSSLTTGHAWRSIRQREFGCDRNRNPKEFLSSVSKLQRAGDPVFDLSEHCLFVLHNQGTPILVKGFSLIK